jgi:hypothetical protein
MSDLLDLQTKLHDTTAALQRARQLLAEDPTDIEFSFVLSSLERRQKTLEDQFGMEAASHGFDICNYRIARSENIYPAAAFADSIKNFQACLTVFFDALQSGPKFNARSSAEIVLKSTLDVGYVYPGSLGVAFTVPNEQALFDTNLDEAISSIFKVMHVSSADALLEFSKRVGPAPIRKIHDWATTNVRYGITTDVQWKHSNEVRQETILQPEEAAQLIKIIEDTKPDEITPVEVIGMLVGGDLEKKSFHLKVPEAADIEGYMGEIFTWPAGQELPLNRRYRASLNKHVILHLATEQEDEAWELLALAEI